MTSKSSLLHGLQDPDYRTARLGTALTGLNYIRDEIMQASHDEPLPEGMIAAIECMIRNVDFEATSTMELLENLTHRIRGSELVK